MDKKFKEKFLRGSAATSIGQASSMAFHFVSIMILTRALTKADFGIYALILVINNLFLILGSLGLDVALVKFISSDKKEERVSVFTNILYTKFLSYSFFAVLFIITGNLFLPLFSEKIIDYIYYIPILFFLGGFRDLFFKVLQGLNYFKKYAVTQIISAIARFLLILFVYTQGNLNLYNLILVEILTLVVVLLAELSIVPFKLLIDKKADKMKLKSILNFALPIYFNNIFGFLYSRIQLVIIGAFLMPVSVAYYDVGAKIPQALKKMFSSFILVFFPNLSKLFSAGQKSSGEKLVNKSLNAVSIVLSIAVLISFLFGSEIISLVFSERYADSSLVFSLLMLNFTLVALANILGYTNLSAGYPKVPMKVNIICSIVSIGGSLVLIPQIGYVGAAYSLIVMNILAQVLYLFYLRKVNFNINVRQYTMPIILLIITAGLYSLLSNDSLNIRLLTVFIFLVLNWFFVTEFKSLFNTIINLVPKVKS